MGIKRPVDKLGRVVIPKELRDRLNMTDNVDSFDISVDGDRLILKKHREGCIFCGSDSEGTVYSGYAICSECLKRLKEIAEENELNRTEA